MVVMVPNDCGNHVSWCVDKAGASETLPRSNSRGKYYLHCERSVPPARVFLNHGGGGICQTHPPRPNHPPTQIKKKNSSGKE